MGDRYRLPSDLQADLSWYWCDADADLGVCSGGDIEHRGPPPDSGPSTSRKPKAETRTEQRMVRHAAKDEEIRLMWHTLKCTGDSHANSIDDPVNNGLLAAGEPALFDRTPMPAWARRIVSRDRAKMTRVHATVNRLARGPNGARHQRVLYRVYGPVSRHPVCYGRVGSELAPLVEYTDAVVAKMAAGALPSEAGEAVLHKGVTEKAVRQVREQAQAMLEAASRAYEACHEAEKTERQHARRARFRALLGAA